MVRTKQFKQNVEPSMLPHQPVSKCLNSGFAFPQENVFPYHFSLDLPSEEAHRTVQWTQSLGFSPLWTEIPQELNFSQRFWATGKKKKKTGYWKKSPKGDEPLQRLTKWTGLLSTNMFHSADLFHALDISGFEVYLGVNKHCCIRISARQQFPF